VSPVLRMGDQELAAKLERQARQLRPRLSKLCVVPRLVFSCPVPANVPKQLHVEVKAFCPAGSTICCYIGGNCGLLGEVALC